MSNSPNANELGRALWCIVMAQGGTAKVSHKLEQEFASRHILAKLEAFVDPVSGETIFKATAEPKSRKGIMRSAIVQTLTDRARKGIRNE